MSLPLFERIEQIALEAEEAFEHVFRVSELNREVRLTLEKTWGDVWVEGELSDVTRAASGHIYFTLNDSENPAQLRCVIFRGDARKAKATFEAGECIRIKGNLSLYEPRGAFQMVAREAFAAGKGDLHAAFERTRRRLEAEGLLDSARKRALPKFARVVGVVTSASGAAVHDIITVCQTRCPVRIIISPCLVQGDQAPASIVAALIAIQRLPEIDVVIVGRGGGAREDLFAFNDEGVARAIAGCRVPVVSAVGHEVDFTIADLVADVRAATPSNAAELIVPELAALTHDVEAKHRALQRAWEIRLGRERLRMDRLTHRLLDPRHALGGVRTKLQACSLQLARAIGKRVALWRADSAQLQERLARLDVRNSLARDRARLKELTSMLESYAQPMVTHRRMNIEACYAQLNALSPLAILARGYSIAVHKKTGRALINASNVETGDSVTVRLHEGQLTTRVEKVN